MSFNTLLFVRKENTRTYVLLTAVYRFIDNSVISTSNKYQWPPAIW